MYEHFANFLVSLDEGLYSPGVILVTQNRYSIGQMIDFIVNVYDLSSHDEWRNQIRDLPL